MRPAFVMAGALGGVGKTAMASSQGGTVVDADGKVTIDNPNAARALDRAAGWIGPISPKGVLNYTEEEARGVFQSDNAVFMRNWPYAWALGQSEGSPVRAKIGVSALPAGDGGTSAAVLGGWQMAVSKYSKNQDAAIDLVTYLCSAALQKDRAIQFSQNPTIAALYKDPEVLEAVPFCGDLYDVFWCRHHVMMANKVVGRYRDQATGDTWRVRPYQPRI